MRRWVTLLFALLSVATLHSRDWFWGCDSNESGRYGVANTASSGGLPGNWNMETEDLFSPFNSDWSVNVWLALNEKRCSIVWLPSPGVFAYGVGIFFEPEWSDTRNGARAEIYYQTNSLGLTVVQMLTNAPLLLDRWFMLTVVRSNDTLSVFNNRHLVSLLTNVTEIQTNVVNHLGIGSTGLYDDVSCFDYAIGINEMDALFTNNYLHVPPVAPTIWASTNLLCKFPILSYPDYYDAQRGELCTTNQIDHPFVFAQLADWPSVLGYIASPVIDADGRRLVTTLNNNGATNGTNFAHDFTFSCIFTPPPYADRLPETNEVFTIGTGVPTRPTSRNIGTMRCDAIYTNTVGRGYNIRVHYADGPFAANSSITGLTSRNVPVPDGGLAHLAVVVTNGMVTWFVNGDALRVSMNGPTRLSYQLISFGHSYPFKGDISRLYFWDKGLDRPEREQLYHGEDLAITTYIGPYPPNYKDTETRRYSSNYVFVVTPHWNSSIDWYATMEVSDDASEWRLFRYSEVASAVTNPTFQLWRDGEATSGGMTNPVITLPRRFYRARYHFPWN